MARKLRLAILECDTPLDSTRARFGGYGEVFRTLLRNGAARITNGSERVYDRLEISKWDVVEKMEYPSLDDIDAVLITGSRYNAFDDTPWIVQLAEFMKVLLGSDRVRTVGICFGHQMAARAMGAPVGRNEKGWELSVETVQLTEQGRGLFEQPTLVLQQMHRDVISALPPGTINLGASTLCPIQGLYVPGQLLTLQGHPEFDAEIMREILETRHGLGIIDAGTFKDGMKRSQNAHDGHKVAKYLLAFMNGTI